MVQEYNFVPESNYDSIPDPNLASPSVSPNRSIPQTAVPLSIIEQLAQMADKSEVMSLLKFKNEQQLDKNDPLWAFLLEFKVIENSVSKQEAILQLIVKDLQQQMQHQLNTHQQRLDTSFNTYSQDLITQYRQLTDNLETVEQASLNLTQTKIASSVAKLVRHAAHTKAVNDWLAMSRLGLYILIPMIFAGLGGWFTRSYLDYRYSNSGLSNSDTALLHWAKSKEGKLAKNLFDWNSRGLTGRGNSLVCEQQIADLGATLTIEGESVTRSWCLLRVRPVGKR
ncbi:MAG: DUF6753 family protein [Cyanobacteria bacterium J06621_8]